MDDSVSKVNSRATLGRVIIGLYGGWLVGFGMVTGLADIFQVEARAMIEGLKLAWAHGFQQVVESDNALLVDILQNGLAENNSVAEVRMIHTWVSKNWQVRIRLISRDCNRVVDCMANEARGDLSSRCQRHVLDMVLHGTSHLGANTMSQTWSYMGPLISVPMPCPKHDLTWDLFTQMS
ncbi:hypothetical protein Gotur_008821 [Gossypium turneri]